MKRRNLIIMLGIILLSSIVIYSNYNAEEQEDKNIKIGNAVRQLHLEEYTSSLKANKKKIKSEEEVYASAKNFQITKKEMKLQMDIYKLSGEKDSEKKAYKAISIRKTLYSLAEKYNCIATNEEIEKYMTVVRNDMKKIEPEYKEQYKKIMQGYGGEDEYWNQTKELYKESLSIKNYLDKIREEENITDDDEWEKYRENLISDKVEEQEIEIINPLQ